MVSKLKREELAKVIMELSKTSWFESIRHDDDEKALILVEEIVKAGWVPIEDFPDEELPVPTQAVVNDVMERIISGLPIEKLYDVASLHPQEIEIVFPDGTPIPSVREVNPVWVTIPDFENYEINKDGGVRSKWTKRTMNVEYRNCASYIEMHDKQGFPHMVPTMTLATIAEELFE